MSNNVRELQEELRQKKAEADNIRKEVDDRENEKKDMEGCVQELERELQMKTAALQSLMLAKKVTCLIFEFFCAEQFLILGSINFRISQTQKIKRIMNS